MALSSEQYRALKMIADAGPNGCTEHALTAQGFEINMIAGLIRDGLATVWPQHVRVGRGVIDVPRIGITDEGRQALAN